MAQSKVRCVCTYHPAIRHPRGVDKLCKLCAGTGTIPLALSVEYGLAVDRSFVGMDYRRFAQSQGYKTFGEWTSALRARHLGASK